MAVIEGGKVIEGAQDRWARVFIASIEDLAADADIAARAEFAAPVEGAQLTKIGVVGKGAAAGIDNTNTAVVAVSDGAGNSIVSKTYNTPTPWPAAGTYDSLGALDATHRVLTANEVVRVAVTQGVTANLPAFLVVFEWEPNQV